MGIYLLIPLWRRIKERFLKLFFYICTTYCDKLHISQMPQIEGISHYENFDILIWQNIEFLIKVILYEQCTLMEKKRQNSMKTL